ncbi:beta/alpha barrel domain-containing protein [Algoriphagus mannitolivorans]|uniref:ketohydroxyglutarate aldolase n=1 Tax=Algoriphagus mannitolivorans TaxID=226504 RepID=UPI000404C4D2|nr:ketohydroxyglutarate aldolase [Algoriphagus mannitolivorans]
MKKLFNPILEIMSETGMIPVFSHSDVAKSLSVMTACYAGGIRVFEFTDRNENSLEVFKELKKQAPKFPGLYLGIGTIFTQEQAQSFIEAEADFIVSPALIPEVAEISEKAEVMWVPGCGTITEVYQAKKMGAKLVKAFPGNVLGPEFIAAAKSVIPDLHYMPTGGVEPTSENLERWFKAGVTCVGMGSQLFKKEWIEKEEYQKLQGAVSETLRIIKKFN